MGVGWGAPGLGVDGPERGAGAAELLLGGPPRRLRRLAQRHLPPPPPIRTTKKSTFCGRTRALVQWEGQGSGGLAGSQLAGWPLAVCGVWGIVLYGVEQLDVSSSERRRYSRLKGRLVGGPSLRRIVSGGVTAAGAPAGAIRARRVPAYIARDSRRVTGEYDGPALSQGLLKGGCWTLRIAGGRALTLDLVER